MKLKILVGVAALLLAHPLHADTHDVVFLVASNAQINWFEIDNPSVNGSITVTNQPYPSNHSLNAAVVDASRNRLLYVDDTSGSEATYAINLTGLTLVPNVATSVTVSSIGNWPEGNDNAGYNKANGRIYYHVYQDIEARTLNFDASGNISGSTTLGDFTVLTTQSIRAGDLDFESSTGLMWVAGINSGSNARLWGINPTTLAVEKTRNPPSNYSGITFDATGTTLYGYTGTNGQYGIINTTNGAFQTVLYTDEVFSNAGDLAEAIMTVAVPEPSALALASIGLMILAAARRPLRSK